MKIIKHNRFRSEGRGVNKTDDMVRVVVDMTDREWCYFKNNPTSIDSRHEQIKNALELYRQYLDSNWLDDKCRHCGRPFINYLTNMALKLK